MTKRIGRLVVSAGVLLGGLAFAGTPLPDPPFSGGGFVPPTKVELTQELAVGKLITTYAKKRTKCDQSAVIALQLAYEPVGMPKVPEVQQKWTDCVQAALLSYAGKRDKLLLKGTPPCLDQAGIDAIRAAVDAQLPLLGPIVYCDDDAAAPDPVTQLNIPDFKNEAEGEVSAAKVVLKAGLYAGKCYMSAVKYAFKFLGVLPPEVLAKIDACFQKASDAADAALLKLDQTQKLPTCLPLATAQGVADAAIATAGALTSLNYCASPSGAFVDG